MNAVRQMDATEPRQCLSPLPPVWRTRDRLPPGRIDTHCHVFAPLAAHPLDAARGGAVAVQPSVYGFDNGVLFAALAAMPGTLRGVAAISPDAPEAVFAQAHRLGVLQRKVLCDNPARLHWAAPRQQSGST